MRIEGLYASCSPSFDPLTDRPFTHPQRYRDILLLPTRLFQLPRSFASFFSPIGFLVCSHTSYLTTLYFPLPRSVVDKDTAVRLAAVQTLVELEDYIPPGATLVAQLLTDREREIRLSALR